MPQFLTLLGDYLYFSANDGTNGYELWRTNGSDTTLVSDINAGVNGSDPNNFIRFGDYLYFSAAGANGYELWRTNGVSTTLAVDVRPGVDGSFPSTFVVVGDYLYFTGYNGTSYYVYRSDGSTAERVPFPIDADQYVSCDCYTTNLAAVGGRLFSTMYSPATGNEFAYLDEPTYVLPETNTSEGPARAWTIALSVLALVTLAAGVGLRRRSGGAQR